jgi:Na+-translocating ferredoxin:NAD+ oxidoreductase RnfD subunit
MENASCRKEQILREIRSVAIYLMWFIYRCCITFLCPCSYLLNTICLSSVSVILHATEFNDVHLSRVTTKPT